MTDPRQWEQVDWYRRGDPTAGSVAIRTGNPSFAIPGTLLVKSYRDVFEEYLQHPEAKAAGPDGQPCRPDTRGLLQPRTVTATCVDRIGKEANRLADTEDLVVDDDDQPVVYEARHCRGCEQPVHGRKRWCSETCRKRSFRQSP